MNLTICPGCVTSMVKSVSCLEKEVVKRSQLESRTCHMKRGLPTSGEGGAEDTPVQGGSIRQRMSARAEGVVERGRGKRIGGRGRGRRGRGGRVRATIASTELLVSNAEPTNVWQSLSQEDAPELRIEGLKDQLKSLSEEYNVLKGKVVKLEGDLLEKDTAMKAMSFQLNRLEEQCRKLSAENESLRFARE